MGSIIDPLLEDLARRRRTFAQRRSLSEYAVSLPSQPSDAIGIHPKDDKFRFFKRGRDFQPRKAKHHFTEDELRVLETYESSAILPSHSEVYRKWLENEGPRGGMEAWGILCLVAVITGTLSFILRLVCEKFQIIYVPWIHDALESNNTFFLWIFFTLASCGSGALAAIVVIYFCPHAAGSGLPEIIGILNGCVVRNVLSFKTLVCKMISVICVVISKLPVGFEGPMVHIGAMVGACMAKPIQRCFRNNVAGSTDQNACCPKGCLSRLCRYRDCQERYSLICVGAASGVASAFSSPISGLTFAMEEISSHWSRKQTWRTFVCCILARSTTELLHSLETTIETLDREHKINIFQLSESALFDMKHNLNLSMLIFIPALVIGALGGLLGAIFIFIHLKASKFRRKLFSYIESHRVQNALKLLEVLVITTICASLVVGVLPLYACKVVEHQEVSIHGRTTLGLRSYNCHKPLQSFTEDHHGKITQSGEYNEGASLLLGSWEQMIRNLLSRKTSNVFGIPVLGTCLLFFWIFSCWTSMTNVSCGLLIPQLAIGALFGRIIGELLQSSLQSVIMDSYQNVGWDWVDPGAFALMGAASFLSGTSRLPITSVVMMVEMSNDVNMSLLVMVCVMVSKFVGDLFTHSLYHSVLEIKCIPYLEPDLTVYDHEGQKVCLELFTSSTVMQLPVQLVCVKESVKFLANLLLDTNHGAFPVVKNDDGMERTYLGIITRLELTILLTKTERFDPTEIGKDDMDRLRISYPEYSSTKLRNTATANMVLNKYSSNIVYKNIYVNLQPYINVSAPSVPPNFCLKRTYIMFTAMGLRHLVVTDRLNQVIGIITRKDLMGFSVEAKIRAALLLNKSVSFTHSGSESVGVDCDIEVQSTVPIVQEENEDNSDLYRNQKQQSPYHSNTSDAS